MKPWLVDHQQAVARRRGRDRPSGPAGPAAPASPSAAGAPSPKPRRCALTSVCVTTYSSGRPAGSHRPASSSARRWSRMCAASSPIAGSATTSARRRAAEQAQRDRVQAGRAGGVGRRGSAVDGARGVGDRHAAPGREGVAQRAFAARRPVAARSRADRRRSPATARRRAVEQQLGRIERAVAEVAPGRGDRRAPRPAAARTRACDVTA